MSQVQLPSTSHLAECCVVADLKFSVILHLNLCFVSEVQGAEERWHERKRSVRCMSAVPYQILRTTKAQVKGITENIVLL